MLRVVHIIGGLGVGGAERMVERLCLEHRKQGLCEPVVVSLADIGEIGQRLRRQGIHVETLGLTGAFNILPVLARLTRLLKALKPDVVQNWLYHADLVGGLAGRLAGIRAVVWNIRCTVAGDSRFTRWLVRLNAGLSHRLPHGIICCGDEARLFHAALGYDDQRMVVLPNGFDATHFNASGKAQRVEGCRFTAIGRHDTLKDYPTLIRAAAQVAAQRSGTSFAIYGKGVPESPAYRELIRELGLAGRFELHGQIDDVRGALELADFYCSSSTHEGFPNVIGEAMLMQLPCIATDAGDSAAIVGTAGLIVQPGDVSALARAMLEMADKTPSERAQLGVLARDRIVQNYEIGAIARRYASYYRSLLNGNEA